MPVAWALNEANMPSTVPPKGPSYRSLCGATGASRKPIAIPPWSLLWRTGDQSEHVPAVRACTRLLSRELGWMEASPVGG
jgi:hypothetical protein